MPQHDEHEGELGWRLRWLRSRQGLSQSELARRLGLTQSAVSRIESGERRLTAAQLIRWAEIVDVDLATLAGSADAAPESPAARRLGDTELSDELLELAYRDETPDAVPARSSPEVAAWSSDAIAIDAALAGPPPTTAHEDRAAIRRGVVGPPPLESRGLLQRPALKPTVFGDVVNDALYLEELAAQLGLPPATHVSWADRRLLGPLSPDPARAARFWRHELGVGVEGPLPDVVTLLEEAGVHVVHARLDVDVPAGACAEVASPVFATALPALPVASRTGPAAGPAAPLTSSAPAADVPPPWPARQRTARSGASLLPFVFVNGARPAVLARFALSHEFAHLALGHRDAYDERIDWSGRSGREIAANAFAEEFLAPAGAVRRWLEARGEPQVDVGVVVDLANHFGVSFWAARYRLRAAGRLPGRRLRALDDTLRRQEWQLIPRQIFLGGLRDTLSVLAAESRFTADPGANLLRMAPLKVRVPARMRTVALELLQRGIVSLEQAAALLRFDVPSLKEQLARLGL